MFNIGTIYFSDFLKILVQYSAMKMTNIVVSIYADSQGQDYYRKHS